MNRQRESEGKVLPSKTKICPKCGSHHIGRLGAGYSFNSTVVRVEFCLECSWMRKLRRFWPQRSEKDWKGSRLDLDKVDIDKVPEESLGTPMPWLSNYYKCPKCKTFAVEGIFGKKDNHGTSWCLNQCQNCGYIYKVRA